MLYTDEQLREMVDKRLPPGPGARTKALALLREVRDTYENRRAATSNDLDDANRRIADLTDELRIWRGGGEWEPVENAELTCACGNCSVPLTVNGDVLELENELDYFQFVLPDGYRLMHRRSQSDVHTPA